MSDPLILAIDQGTSSTKCLLVDRRGAVVGRGSAPLGERYPKPGWVDQDADEVWDSVRRAVADCLSRQDHDAVVGVAISSQRESCVMWDRRSGKALAPIISWQDQRTGTVCDDLRSPEVEQHVRNVSGLPLDPMFTAAKAKWLLDEFDPDRARTRSGEICLGTVDAWLLSHFSSEAVIEAGNAARTQLLDVRRVAWQHDLLEIFEIPAAALPSVVASTGPFPAVKGLPPLKDGVPVLAVMGDSHAALFAQGGFSPGHVKATYGTGSSVMGLVDESAELDPGLCFTIAWSVEQPAFAAEGNIRAAGSTLRWTAEILGTSPAGLADLAASAESEDICLVPGFNGLGAPWWDRNAVALLVGLSLSTSRAAIARAALESIPHQVADVVEAIERSTGPIAALHIDGGPTKNDLLAQLQADFCSRPVLRAHTAELSALGAAHLAGVEAGFWSWKELAGLPRERDRFNPRMPASARNSIRRRWRAAVARARGTGASGETRALPNTATTATSMVRARSTA